MKKDHFKQKLLFWPQVSFKQIPDAFTSHQLAENVILVFVSYLRERKESAL